MKNKHIYNKLDLHGTRLIEVKQKVIATIEQHWDTDVELQIITGHSGAMKEEVINVIKEYKLSYTVGDLLGLNKGYITIKM